jgi:hypothetical protein
MLCILNDELTFGSLLLFAVAIVIAAGTSDYRESSLFTPRLFTFYRIHSPIPPKFSFFVWL